MAQMKTPCSVLVRGTGSSLPRRVLSNDDFAKTLETSDQWIFSRTGIRERRIAADDETAATLGITASRRALEASGVEAGDLDLIVCASVTHALICPSVACFIQAALGCRPIGAFDVVAACSGFVYALSVGEQFLRNGAARHVLVVGTETLSRVSDFADRSTCILFGDGAGACVLSASDEPGRGLRSIRLYADGKRGELIKVPGVTSYTRFFPPPEGVPGYLTLSGREVFRFAVSRMAGMLHDALAECRAAGGDIDLLVPHQVNQRIIDAALSETGFPADRVMVNIDRYGNTSAASVPIALDEAIRTGRARPGDTVLLLAFGGGLTWSSALLTL
jgi:3-oxoacyl-[acyl-carrier-protein] synthase-3